ncbi:unnamed protein product [Cylicocyclus nassatus]|uniref:Uncharacterized protein n=1 Tax=Cylicocyclus nassatus TaxID=53992 RepID=A0AA36GV80_CYLNA|nr:unnamed protein product [Cylicocyclus nassatus]
MYACRACKKKHNHYMVVRKMDAMVWVRRKRVFVTKLISKDTVEVDIHTLARKKLSQMESKAKSRSDETSRGSVLWSRKKRKLTTRL